MSQRTLAITALILIASLWIASQFAISSRRKFSTTSSYSESATGVSILYNLAQQLGTNVTSTKRSAILDSKELAGIDVFLLLSPRQPISEREAGLLASFVRTGGSLFLSFESERSWTFLEPLLEEFDISFNVKPDEKFKNKQLEKIPANRDSRLLRPEAKYGFYSRLIFQDKACESSRLNCFWRERSIGEGNIYIVAGLPPFGNVLLSREHNRFLAFSLLDRYHTIVFDEYRHFFSEKTLKDLLLHPQFSLPLAGLALGALAFFLFGYNRLQDPNLLRRQRAAKTSYHQLNSEILLGLLERSGSLADAVERQRRYLEHLFPERKPEIAQALESQAVPQFASEPYCLRQAAKLTELHRTFLADKRFLIDKEQAQA